jgi:transcriptional regulator GlxA family with amidase domain
MNSEGSMAKQQKVVFFIAPGVHLLDLSGPVQAFHEARGYGGDYALEYCSFVPDMVDSTGLHFSQLKLYHEVKLTMGDYFFIPGFSSTQLKDREHRDAWPAFYSWLQQQASKDVRICSVCVGAFILAEAGLLEGRRCTTHWSLIQRFRDAFPTIRVMEELLFVQDGNIYTSAGISSGIDLALHLLEEAHGPLLAHKVARELVVYSRRAGSHSQESIYLSYRNHMHPGIHQLQDWLVDHLHIRCTIEQLAERVHMSSRNLTRTFKVHTGISIHQYITLLRLEKSRTLRNTPGITVSRIASECGFENERQLQRIWKKQSTAA